LRKLNRIISQAKHKYPLSYIYRTFDVNKLTVILIDVVQVIFIVAGVIARIQITGVLDNQNRGGLVGVTAEFEFF
jgi:hypothetical protein